MPELRWLTMKPEVQQCLDYTVVFLLLALFLCSGCVKSRLQHLGHLDVNVLPPVILWQDGALVREWAEKIWANLQRQQLRPRRLLVLLNPFGGAQRARQIWATRVQPIFDRSGIACHVLSCLMQAALSFVGFVGLSNKNEFSV